MKTRYSAAALLLLILAAGCQPTGTTATTRPTLATVTTQGQDAFDSAVNGVRLAIALNLIDNATYWRDIDPAVMAGQAACARLRAATIAHDSDAWRAANDAALAAAAKLQPYARFPPSTQKAN